MRFVKAGEGVRGATPAQGLSRSRFQRERSALCRAGTKAPGGRHFV